MIQVEPRRRKRFLCRLNWGLLRYCTSQQQFIWLASTEYNLAICILMICGLGLSVFSGVDCAQMSGHFWVQFAKILWVLNKMLSSVLGLCNLLQILN